MKRSKKKKKLFKQQHGFDLKKVPKEEKLQVVEMECKDPSYVATVKLDIT